MSVQVTIVDGRILAKAGPIKGKPGLVLQPSKTDPRQKRWQLTGAKPVSIKDRTLKELRVGLGKWVEDYKKLRKLGNVKDAKKVKANIDAAIKQKGLDAKLVYGEVLKKPTKQNVTQAYLEEKIEVGGEMIRRGNLIREWQKQGVPQRYIDAYMRGHAQGKTIREKVKKE